MKIFLNLESIYTENQIQHEISESSIGLVFASPTFLKHMSDLVAVLWGWRTRDPLSVSKLQSAENANCAKVRVDKQYTHW